MIALLALPAGYIIGGFPTGILICRWLRGVDPRSSGSGSSGATNVSRVLGKKWAIVVLLIDALKGGLPVAFLAPLIAPGQVPLAAALMTAGLMVGHVFTPYAGFRGGKGVAVAAGAMVALDPLCLLIGLAAWAVLFALWRVVSLGSILAALAFSVSAWLLPGRALETRLVSIFAVLFIIYTHRSNIARLFHGQEKRLI